MTALAEHRRPHEQTPARVVHAAHESDQTTAGHSGPNTTPQFLSLLANELTSLRSESAETVIVRIMELSLKDGLQLAEQCGITGERLLRLLVARPLGDAKYGIYQAFGQLITEDGGQDPLVQELFRLSIRNHGPEGLAEYERAKSADDVRGLIDRVESFYAQFLRTKQFEPSDEVRSNYLRRTACALLQEFSVSYTCPDILVSDVRDALWARLRKESSLANAVERAWQESPYRTSFRSATEYRAALDDPSSHWNTTIDAERSEVINRLLPSSLALPRSGRMGVQQINQRLKALWLYNDPSLDSDLYARDAASRTVNPLGYFLYRNEIVRDFCNALRERLDERGLTTAKIEQDPASGLFSITFPTLEEAQRGGIDTSSSIGVLSFQALPPHSIANAYVLDGELWTVGSSSNDLQAVKVVDGQLLPIITPQDYGPGWRVNSIQPLGAGVLIHAVSANKSILLFRDSSGVSHELITEPADCDVRRFGAYAVTFSPTTNRIHRVNDASNILSSTFHPSDGSLLDIALCDRRIVCLHQVPSPSGTSLYAHAGEPTLHNLGFKPKGQTPGRNYLVSEGELCFTLACASMNHLPELVSIPLRGKPTIIPLPSSFHGECDVILRQCGDRALLLLADQDIYSRTQRFQAFTPFGKSLFGGRPIDPALVIEGNGQLFGLTEAGGLSELFDENGETLTLLAAHRVKFCGASGSHLHLLVIDEDGSGSLLSYRLTKPHRLEQTNLAPTTREQEILTIINAISHPSPELVREAQGAISYAGWRRPALDRSSVITTTLTEAMHRHAREFVGFVPHEHNSLDISTLRQLVRRHLPHAAAVNQSDPNAATPQPLPQSVASFFAPRESTRAIGGDPSEKHPTVIFTASGGYSGFLPVEVYLNFFQDSFQAAALQPTVHRGHNDRTIQCSIPVALESKESAVPTAFGGEVSRASTRAHLGPIALWRKELDMSLQGGSCVVHHPTGVNGLQYALQVPSSSPDVPELTVTQYEHFKTTVLKQTVGMNLAPSSFDKDTRVFLKQIERLPLKDRLGRILQFVRENSQYDSTPPSLPESENRSVPERLADMRRRANELAGGKLFAGVCADFAVLSVALCESTGIRAGFAAGLLVQDGKATMDDFHGIAVVPWPHPRGGVQFIAMDGTPADATNQQGETVQHVDPGGLVVPEDPLPPLGSDTPLPKVAEPGERTPPHKPLETHRTPELAEEQLPQLWKEHAGLHSLISIISADQFAVERLFKIGDRRWVDVVKEWWSFQNEGAQFECDAATIAWQVQGYLTSKGPLSSIERVKLLRESLGVVAHEFNPSVRVAVSAILDRVARLQ